MGRPDAVRAQDDPVQDPAGVHVHGDGPPRRAAGPGPTTTGVCHRHLDAGAGGGPGGAEQGRPERHALCPAGTA